MSASLASSSRARIAQLLAEGVGPQSMPMRMMGNTGLQVSVLSFGFWATYGVKKDLQDDDGVKTAKAVMSAARNAGVNLFDHAETYGNPQGAAEMVFGHALKQLKQEDAKLWARHSLIITTKIFWGGPDPNQKGLSRKHLREGLDASLERLQLDYVDMVFCHRPDPLTPTETVVRGMTDLVRSGKVHYWGTSEWSAQQWTEAYWIAQMHGLEPPQFEQPQYHMFWRDRFEKEYFPLFRAPYHMGTTTWSPLASGLLSGKYVDGTIPESSRANTEGYAFVKNKVDTWVADGTMDKVKKLKKYAEEELGCTVAQLALAWSIRNGNATTTLLGATSVEQIRENLSAVCVAKGMSNADDEAVEKILGNKPDMWAGFGGSGMRQITRMENFSSDTVRIQNPMLPLPRAVAQL
ncbi:unnamed protein product [Amoebophrya sp. A25]|nr:unnamed protein product [Amoebophrya sp. A25]|eukprot:GSA25T00010196001.1